VQTHLLDITGLSVRYGAVEAVHNADLWVDEGQLVALIGPNGAGKSSLMQAIVGLVRASSGEIRVDGARIDGMATELIARSGIALVPEGRRIFGGLTVRENLRLGARGRVDADRTVDGLLQRFPILGTRAGEPARTLSGGETQQLAICRALCAEPRLLLLDEPSLGLAPQIIASVYDLIGELKQAGTTVLVVEQAAPYALRLADRAYIAASGVVRSAGVSDLLDPDRLREAYLGEGAAAEEAAWLS
jgi:branched-chain amino acid transport system ATP-binding protein